MSQNYYLLATEGPHDQAAITKLLELAGLKRFSGKKKALDPFWEGLIPTYPPPGGNLYARMMMPSLLYSETHSVAVYWGEGSNLIPNLIALATNHKRYAQDIQAFGLIVDADHSQPDRIAKEKAQGLRLIFPAIPDTPGVITAGSPRTGIYVLPDNKRTGVLDSVLMDCASVIYPDHKRGASQFINELNDMHTVHLQRAFVKQKATVACIVSVVRPGAANTASIAQDEWICDSTVNSVNDLAQLYQFIKTLLDFP